MRPNTGCRRLAFRFASRERLNPAVGPLRIQYKFPDWRMRTVADKIFDVPKQALSNTDVLASVVNEVMASPAEIDRLSGSYQLIKQLIKHDLLDEAERLI